MVQADTENRFDTGYCRARALERIRERYPEATETCFPGDYCAGFWNDEKAYINRKASWEYPGCWYPGPVAFSDEDMIELLVSDGLANLSAGKTEREA